MRVSLIEGNGIGPEITTAVQEILEVAGAEIEWEKVPSSPDPDRQLDYIIESVKRTGVALKAPLATPVGEGHRSLNVRMRQELDLYSCVRPVFSIPGLSKYEDVDLVIVRENSEGLYVASEFNVGNDSAVAMKVVTRSASRKIGSFAVLKTYPGKRLTCVHKANILKLTDGLFLDSVRDVVDLSSADIKFDDMIVDNCAMQLVKNPSQFDVIVTTNLYGDILSDLCAGLVGGLGVCGGYNLGEEYVVFEATHGTAPDIAGKGIANPSALLFSAIMMLEFYGRFGDIPSIIRSALMKCLSNPNSRTKDLGGNLNTEEFVETLSGEIVKWT